MKETLRTGHLTRQLDCRFGNLLFSRKVEALGHDNNPIKVEITATESDYLFIDASLYGEGNYSFPPSENNRLRQLIFGTSFREEFTRSRFTIIIERHHATLFISTDTNIDLIQISLRHFKWPADEQSILVESQNDQNEA
jgi:hypothetical protein